MSIPVCFLGKYVAPWQPGPAWWLVREPTTLLDSYQQTYRKVTALKEATGTAAAQWVLQRAQLRKSDFLGKMRSYKC